MDKPVTHQELFMFAIKAQRTVISEYYGAQEFWVLRKWARGYAEANGLQLPSGDEVYGIFYEPDAEEIQFLQNEGLL